MRSVVLIVFAVLALGAAWFATRDGAQPAAEPAASRPKPGVAVETSGPALVEKAPKQRRAAAPASGPVPAPKVAAEEQGEAIVQSRPAGQPAAAGLAVELVDEAGAPVPGIRVELLMQQPGKTPHDVAKSETDLPTGRALLDLGNLLVQRPMMERAGLTGGFSVRAIVASSEPVEVQLDGWPVDGDTVQLQLPPMGSMLVHLVDGEGEPIAASKSVSWGWLPAEVAARDSGQTYEWMRDHGGSAEGVDPVPIVRVGLGLALSLRAYVPGRVGGQLTAVPGPTRPGEVVAVTLTVGEALAQVRFRCEDPQGQPIAAERVRAVMVERTQHSGEPMARERRGSRRVSTDSDGVGSLALAPGRSKTERWLEVSAGRAYPRNEGELGLCGGWVPLPLELAPGEIQTLPNVVLEPARAVVEGRVTGVDEQPLKGARVYVNQVFQPGKRVAWNGWDWFQRTDEDGRFRILDTVQPGAIAVRVSAAEHRDHYTAEDMGSGQDLQIVLERTERKPRGTLVVQVEMPKGVPFTRCLLKFARQGGRSHSPDWAAGYRMKLDYLEPGTYDVYVVTRDGSFELGRVRDVVVHADQVTEDARLLPLDLTGSAHAVSFVFQDLKGTPRRRERIALWFLPAQGELQVRTNDRGEATALLLTSHINGVAQDEQGVRATFTVGPQPGPVVVSF